MSDQTTEPMPKDDDGPCIVMTMFEKDRFPPETEFIELDTETDELRVGYALGATDGIPVFFGPYPCYDDAEDARIELLRRANADVEDRRSLAWVFRLEPGGVKGYFEDPGSEETTT